MEEHAGDAGDDEQQQRGKADAGDAAVVDVEEIGDAAHDGHAAAGGGGGVEDDAGAEVLDIALDERTDLPAHEVRQDEKHAKREAGAGLAGEADAEHEPHDDDEADKGSPGRRGGDSEGRDEKSERGDGEHLGEQRGGLLARDVDRVVVTVAQVVVVHCHGFAPAYFRSFGER